MAKATISKGVKTKTTWANALKRDWQLYLLLMIPVALVVIFNYASYGGIRMVFMDYKPAKGYAGSKWVGWATFQKVFKDKDFIRALKSSIVFNLLDLAVGFPMPIILALILNELRFPRFKKVTQTILYLPHFLSWVIVGSVAYQMFRPNHWYGKRILNECRYYSEWYSIFDRKMALGSNLPINRCMAGNGLGHHYLSGSNHWYQR